MFADIEDDDDDESPFDNKWGVKKESKSSFEWKNAGFSSEERLTLKINVKEANVYDAKKKNNIQATKNPLEKLPKNINNMRKKIRDVYDEDEDEDEWGVVIAKAPEEYDNSLMKALDENEKKAYQQQQDMKNVNMLQNAGKMEALAVAQKMAQEIGSKGLNKKDIGKEMQNALFNPEKAQEKVLKKDILQEKGIKGDLKLKNMRDVVQTVRGIKKVEQIGGEKNLKDMDIKDLQKVGNEKKSNKDVAEIIIEKRGLKKEDAEKIRQNAAKEKEKTYEFGKDKQNQMDKLTTRRMRDDKQHVHTRS